MNQSQVQISFLFLKNIFLSIFVRNNTIYFIIWRLLLVLTDMKNIISAFYQYILADMKIEFIGLHGYRPIWIKAYRLLPATSMHYTTLIILGSSFNLSFLLWLTYLWLLNCPYKPFTTKIVLLQCSPEKRFINHFPYKYAYTFKKKLTFSGVVRIRKGSSSNHG